MLRVAFVLRSTEVHPVFSWFVYPAKLLFTSSVILHGTLSGRTRVPVYSFAVCTWSFVRLFVMFYPSSVILYGTFSARTRVPVYWFAVCTWFFVRLFVIFYPLALSFVLCLSFLWFSVRLICLVVFAVKTLFALTQNPLDFCVSDSPGYLWHPKS